MNPTQCSESWLVEAIRDGRVAGAERTSFERHLATCNTCRDQSRNMASNLERLAQLPSGLPDAFTLRRERRALLRAFDSSLLANAEAPTRWRVRLAFVCAVASATLLAGLFLVHRSTRRSSWVDVATDAEASWSEHRTERVDQLTLKNGHFHLSIHRPTSAERVTIALPDGEVEDLGTELTVWIDGGRTSYVAVDRGSVVLRLHGAPETKLVAGDHWRQAANVAQPASMPAVSDREANHQTSESPARVVAHTKPAKATAAVPSKAAIDRGAAQLSREDAAYLHALALLEAGQRTEARAAADEYLREYPDGFRRLEALSIATSAPPSLKR